MGPRDAAVAGAHTTALGVLCCWTRTAHPGQRHCTGTHFRGADGLPSYKGMQGVQGVCTAAAIRRAAPSQRYAGLTGWPMPLFG